MASIFDIEKDKLDLFEELENNGGELTPELKEALQLNEQETTAKVKSYVEYINKLKGDIALIKSEKDRLDKLQKSKETAIKSISHLVTYAINHFGVEDKKGKRYFDWGTGKVSIRQSIAIEANTKTIDAITDVLKTTYANAMFTGTLNANDSIDEAALLDACQNHVSDDEYNSPDPIDIETEDIDDITVNITVPVNMRALLSGDAYQLMSKIADVNCTGWQFKPTIDKKAMKEKLVTDGCVSNIAKAVVNENLSIK